MQQLMLKGTNINFKKDQNNIKLEALNNLIKYLNN